MRRRSAVTSTVITSWPSISTWPLLGSASRLTIFRLVVLPQPLGPTRTQMSPAGTSSDRATTAPLGPYLLLTWRDSTLGLGQARPLPPRAGAPQALPPRAPRPPTLGPRGAA